MKIRPTTLELAVLILYLARTYDSEKKRSSTRFRLSRRTLRRLALRSRMEDEFLKTVFAELSDLGWAAFPVGDNFGFVAIATVDDWPRIGTKDRTPVLAILKQLAKGQTEKLHELLIEYEAADLIDDDED